LTLRFDAITAKVSRARAEGLSHRLSWLRDPDYSLKTAGFKAGVCLDSAKVSRGTGVPIVTARAPGNIDRCAKGAAVA
jgi:hypothetical protein